MITRLVWSQSWRETAFTHFMSIKHLLLILQLLPYLLLPFEVPLKKVVRVNLFDPLLLMRRVALDYQVFV